MFYLLPWPVFFFTEEGREAGEEISPSHTLHISDILKPELSEPIWGTHCPAKLNQGSHPALLPGQLGLCLPPAGLSLRLMCEERGLYPWQQRQTPRKIQLHFNRGKSNSKMVSSAGRGGCEGEGNDPPVSVTLGLRRISGIACYCWALGSCYSASHVGI